MRESTHFGAKEATSDPCGPRELSAAPFKGSREFPWLTWVKAGFVGLLRDRSRRPWADPNVPRPEQTRKCERKFGKNERNPVREKRVNDGCARLAGPRTVTTSSRGRVRVVRNPWNVMARLAEVVGGNGTSGGSAREFDDFWLKSGRVVIRIPGGFPMVLAGFGLDLGLDGTWVRGGG
ncbi:hypothetical protein CRG98_021294 [Punica granatum]|uniref:Uncharacterized protein n=1 Tax=Punica granatum TaxID=22663 RepID=A0A2I0JPU5_PUNGR|nr:hypothetical protein CRG98_021294 [Punica granatum]